MKKSIFSVIESHNLDELSKILENGANPNEYQLEWPGFTPLHVAIDELEEGGSLDALSFLLKYGAKVDGWDSNKDSTPLLMSVFRHNTEAVELLLKAGADPNVVGGEGDSPLRFCVGENDLETVKLLVSNGANKTINAYGGFCGLTALGMAAKNLNLSMVQILLQAGADPNAIDEDDRTAIERVPERTVANAEIREKVLDLLS